MMVLCLTLHDAMMMVLCLTLHDAMMVLCLTLRSLSLSLSLVSISVSCQRVSLSLSLSLSLLSNTANHLNSVYYIVLFNFLSTVLLSYFIYFSSHLRWHV